MDFFDELEKIVKELWYKLQSPDEAPIWQNMLYSLGVAMAAGGGGMLLYAYRPETFKLMDGLACLFVGIIICVWATIGGSKNK